MIDFKQSFQIMGKLVMKTYKKVGLALTMLVPGVSNAGLVDADIAVESVTYLRYYSTLGITIDATAMAALLDGGTSCVAAAVGFECDYGNAGFVTATYNAGDLDVSYTAIVPPDLSAVTLNISNAWEVDGVQDPTGAGTVVMNAALNQSVPLANGGSTISITSVSPAPASFSGPSLSGDLGGYTAVLDLSGLSLSGTHTVAGQEITVSITSI